MATKPLLLVVCALLAACTNITIENFEDPMPKGDGRILDQRDASTVGIAKVLGPATFFRATGAEPVVGSVRLFTPPDMPLFKPGGADADAQNITVFVDSFPIQASGAIGAGAERVMLYGVARFGSGSAQFGSQENTGALGSTLYSSEVLFDIGVGTAVVFPASALDFGVRAVGIKRAAYAANDIVMPQFKINACLAYGDKETDPGSVSFTEAFVTLAAGGGSFIFNRRKFSYAVEFTWVNFATAGPLAIEFWGENGTPLWNVSIAAGGVIPPRLPWPEGAQYLSVVNTDGVNQMNFLTCKQYLSL